MDSGGLPNKQSTLRRLDGTQRGYTPQAEAAGVDPAGWAARNSQRGETPIAVHLLLGGEDRSDWALWPEQDAILIGTQDMLLSRALNRGYAAGRARWPMEFGLLNNDCLWVFDEIQLMDTGLATSLQFDAWRQSLWLRPERSAFPKPTSQPANACNSIWMSATMAEHWLTKAIDWEPNSKEQWKNSLKLDTNDHSNHRVRALFQNNKTLRATSIKLQKPKTKDGNAIKDDARQKQSEYLKLVTNHISSSSAQSGLTLVIANTVNRATDLFELLQEKGVPNIFLMHSRFRPIEREKWQQLIDQKDNSARILVATQVVEAGVDLSAKVLYTELAPWASLVQRFGRCARYPQESGNVFWLDLGTEIEHWARPYQPEQLNEARKVLEDLGKTVKDVGLKSLTDLSGIINPEKLFPYEPRFVPREKDLFDLFDTTPDLTGADVDISRFIRDGEELDVQVFWREIAPAGPDKKDRPDRRELCPVPFHKFREALPSLLKAGRIYRHSYLKGWHPLGPRSAETVYPGQIYLLDKSCGGYSTITGWTGNHNDTDFTILEHHTPSKETLQDDEDDSDDLSHLQPEKWLTVNEHTLDVCKKLNVILATIQITNEERTILELAARWHDRGKAHIGFQSKLKSDWLDTDEAKLKLGGEPAAKAPDQAWKRGQRSGFRHELASALAILETVYISDPKHLSFAWPEGLNKSDFGVSLQATPGINTSGNDLLHELSQLSADDLDLLVYLVASHHGKVRMSIRSSPEDDSTAGGTKQARGVRDNDILSECQIPNRHLDASVVSPKVQLHLDLMDLGLSPRYGASWRERTQLLVERIGPFKLAYLEALLRSADCRASIDEDHAEDTSEKEA